MRPVNQFWLRLVAGVERAEQLETALHDEWSDRVRATRDRLNADAEATWQSEEDERVRRYQTALAEWRQRESRRLEQVERDRLVWAADKERARHRVRARVQSIGVPGFTVSAGMAARRPSRSWTAPLAVAVAALAPVVPSMVGLALLSMKDPAARTKPEPQPVDPGPAPRPVLQPEDPVPLEVKKPWLRRLAGGYVPYRERNDGDEGVDDFLRALVYLPDSYMVVRELLVNESLDVDAVVLGPSGIWLFEIKHWSGLITCTRGKWTRRQEHFASGGRLTTNERPIGSVDGQWLREADAVRKALLQNLGRKRYATRLLGGLVFTHPKAQIEIDDSCRCPSESPRRWVENIRQASPLADFGSAEQFAVLDVLFEHARGLAGQTNGKTADAVELADEIFETVSDSAAAYCAV